MGLLDQAIEATPAGRSSSNRVDRILERLTPHLDADELEQLMEILIGNATEWGHTRVADVLAKMCEAAGVEHENIAPNNVQDWRKSQR